MTQIIQKSYAYCRDLVAVADPDRYFAAFFGTRAVRPALWALLAFNQEIAKTREVVTETTIGLMRLQWWRDTVDKLCNGQSVAGNPLIDALFDTIRSHHLSREEFETLIYAREFDLEGVLPANLQGLEHYADYTTTSLLMLMAQVCGVTDLDRERVRYLAVAYALVGLVRAVPFHARQARCYLPQELLDAHAITVDTLYALKPVPELVPIVRDICVLAREHLLRATDLASVRPFRALIAITDLYLTQIERVGCDIFSPKLAHPPAFKELRVWVRVALGRFGN